MSSQQQSSTTPINERDSWSTPDYVFRWADRRFDFAVDLAASAGNTKCIAYIDEQADALAHDWAESFLRLDMGFLNPPYSNIRPWVKKAHEESLRGFGTVVLIPTPNGEQVYRDHVFGKAAEIIFINGRLAFLQPDGTPKTGNTRGSCFVVYRPYHRGQTALSWVDMDDMQKEFGE